MNKIWRFTKTRWLLLIVLSLLCWTSTGDANYNAVKSEDKIMYALFENMFTEPIEVLYLLTNDMRGYKLTSNYENIVLFRMWELEKTLKRDGYKISDIIVIIHNHTTQAYFSRRDIISYKVFKSNGFEGKFYIYVSRNRTIYELAENLR